MVLNIDFYRLYSDERTSEDPIGQTSAATAQFRQQSDSETGGVHSLQSKVHPSNILSSFHIFL